MATTVEITLGDDKTLTVGIAEQPSADLDDSQQVATLDQALAMAKHLLTNPPPDSDEGDEDGAPDADDAGGAAGGAAQPMPGGGAGLAASATPAAGGAGQGGASAGGGGGDAQAMWDQLAQQQGPAH